MTKSHCCDSQTVGNYFIGNTVVTLGGTLPMYSMSCDNNFKSQEHLKNLGTAVEIVSVHTDLHRHIVPIKGYN